MKKIISLSMVIATALFIGGCSISATKPKVTNPTSTPVVEVLNKIDISGFIFNPTSLTIKKGTAVTWTNSDTAPHSIKSDTFNSPMLSKGQSFSFTFNEVGTFDYVCSVHPVMKGKIIVE
jgi:amicyanin